MRHTRSLSAICLLLLWLPGAAQESLKVAPLAAQAINLLSYIAVDYGDSVHNGEVLYQFVYMQQRRNLTRALQLVRQLPQKPGREALERRLEQLDRAMAARSDAEAVRRQANAAADRLAALYQLQRAPAQMLPSADLARPLYASRCARCHGARGQGSGGAPALRSPGRMGSFSLYDLYNTLNPLADTVHGRSIDGDLNSRQRWALAVTVANFSAHGEVPSRELVRRYPALVGLPGMATTRPVELPPEAAAALRWWRGHPLRARALEPPVARITGLLQLAETAYRGGDKATAYHRLTQVFREDYAPLRERLRQRDAPLEARVSAQWRDLRRAILGSAPDTEVIAAFQRLQSDLAQVRQRLQPASAGDKHTALWAAILLSAAVALGLLLWLALRRRDSAQRKS